MIKYLALLMFGVVATSLTAANPEWVPVATELLKQQKTGYGGLCGIAVDQESGHVWANLSDLGMFHSADQGMTWERASESQCKGRTESPGCFLIDPTGRSQRMVTALVYGDPISISDDSAANWKSLHAISKHIDWCAVDWSDADLRFILAIKHEASGLLLSSNDGGQSFQEVGKGYGTGWVFDRQTAVVAEAKSIERPYPRLMRTTDGGKAFRDCGQFSPVGTGSAQALPRWHDGVLYWLTDSGLIKSSDKGETWQPISTIKDAQFGPIFGRSLQHMFVLTKSGPVESNDAGATWSAPIAPPNEMNGIGGLSWLQYDPRRDTLYLMKMGSDLFRLDRKR